MGYVGCSGTCARAETQSWAVAGRRNAAGITPTTWTGSPSSESVRPRTAGSAPKRRRQSDSDSTATRGPCGPGSMTRPSNGPTPSTRKKSAETSAPSTRSGSPSLARLKPRALTAAIAPNGSAPSAQERKSAPVTVRRVPRGSDCQAKTSRSASAYGSALQKSASATSSTVSAAPRPRPSTATVSARKPRRRQARLASPRRAPMAFTAESVPRRGTTRRSGQRAAASCNASDPGCPPGASLHGGTGDPTCICVDFSRFSSSEAAPSWRVAAAATARSAPRRAASSSSFPTAAWRALHPCPGAVALRAGVAAPAAEAAGWAGLRAGEPGLSVGPGSSR